MGWFKKTDDEHKNEKKQNSKPKELTECPVCKSKTFQKVDYFNYYEKEEVNGTHMVHMKKRECNNFVGDNTGYCSNCGGIIRGFIYIFNDEEFKGVNTVGVAECNRIFIAFFYKLKEAGAGEIKLKTYVDQIREENINVFDKWNLKTFIVIAMNNIGLQFSSEVDEKFQKIIDGYKQLQMLSITTIASFNRENGLDFKINEQSAENINKYIEAIGSFLR